MKTSNYLACPECDLLLRGGSPVVGEKEHCPRCHCLLHRPRANSITRTLALSLTGLFLLFPANLLPIVGIKVLGNSNDGTLLSGAVTLFNEGMWGVAILVFLSSILFPLLSIVLSLLISGHLYFNHKNHRLSLWLRTLQHIEEWAMLEVYLLGIIVACVKLSSMAELKFGLGLAAFILLLLVSVTLASNFDSTLFWQRIEQLNTDENK
ncbi:MAG: paraquat-inducible protein A [Methylococcales bacterium]|nr:paraquat-inducible protein A [Methylococcales bacterium]MDD5755128.1 paraquat-inducible protein A [Methylococcales bacterium]